ncbi:asparagine synthase (glutamine-hydrolyzing) [Cecembia lonarensis]|uniref:asparagine synthase (glutamine-hydrolyzing) n=1 Tax=Cecembia lonarensis (strain CCUG 58316 / KCTC 22772 / LW9) TaxID=1225176 RepID=K1LKE2_CECL9|nr:asparagine synthase (glutamine-hydrolyzing) [Cecembia lonarensis]EKB50793.1 Asparagine synthetase (glutamine-hydrolyzing) 1 [Cecembia lonarensis LW9]
MCGINVIIGTDQEKEIQSMMQATLHRGPDHSSWCQVTENLYLSGNRLKILDLSENANQPLWTKEKDAVLVWNGALYNYQDLRNELLELGYQFQSNSDSEVLIYWLRHHGAQGIHALEGMFALAFVDLNKKSLLIARDPSGEKPLYYSKINGKWYFSSESKAIQQALLPKPCIDSQQFSYYYFLRHAHPSASFFEGIRQFPIGTYRTIDLVKDEEKTCTWSSKAVSKESRQADALVEILKDAVLKSFHAERPVGTMLSGGADSSLIYALWYEETGEPLPAYTITYPKNLRKKYADPNFVQSLNKHYPLLYRPVELTLEKVQANWTAYIQSLDQPIGDSAGFLTWMLAKEASKDIKVLISGAGADELFGGYNRHIAFASYLRHPRIWLSLKKLGLHKFMSATAFKFMESIMEDPISTFIQMAALEKVPGQLINELINHYPQQEGELKSALEWDRTWYLVNDILKIHDNACMAHGVEGRAPFLDNQLISISQSMTEDQHREQLGKKWIKTALDQRGLRFISKRKKLGFGLPLAEWMPNRAFQDWTYPTIINMAKEWGDHLPDEMRKLAAAPQKAKGRQFLQVWNLFLLASWIEHQKT